MSRLLNSFPENFLAHTPDSRPFKYQHKLLGHPSMSLKNLAEVSPALNADQVYHSSGKVGTGSNFARSYIDNKNGLSVEETIHTMHGNDSFIMVRNPESHPSFRELFRELSEDMKAWMKAHGHGKNIIDPMFYMFIASPNSVTPFHIDRISTVLMQFAGSKTVTLFPAWDPRTVSQEVAEGFMLRTGVRPEYHPSFEDFSTPFDFGPGESLHIPFLAPHHVKNGPKDVSISLSITFHSERTEKLKQAMYLNHLMRHRLRRRPSAVGIRPRKDRVKARIYRGYAQVRDLMGVSTRNVVNE